MAIAPTTAKPSAVQTGEIPIRYPAATPANATWPIPSPISVRRRWTRKKPMAGATRPTIAPAASARRMNSKSRMDMRRVVPEGGQLRRRAVELDASAYEQQPVGEVLDGAELVRDVEDCHVEFLLELAEQAGKR